MILQYRDVKGGYIIWRDYLVDGEVVKSPVDIDELPYGRYQLVDNWKEKHLESIKDSREFFSNQNKLEREKFVVSRLLEQIIPDFKESDLKEGEEPADVQFREANFQVKEIVPAGRRRGDEFKAAKKRIETATEYSETLQTYTPKDLILSQIVADCDGYAHGLRKKYGVREIKKIDLVFYHNDTHAWELSSDYNSIVNKHFRSLSVVSNRFRVVVYANDDAPDFLQNAIGKVQEINKDEY